MTPFVAATSIFAPFTDALPLVRANSVSVNVDVPSAFRVSRIELILRDATLKFTDSGVVTSESGGGTVEPEPAIGVPALPPPPPQATKANVNPSAAMRFMKLIINIP